MVHDIPVMDGGSPLALLWSRTHHKLLRAVSVSGRHQGAHVDIICTNTVYGWALVPPASVAHRTSPGGLATDCVDGVSLQMPCRGGLPRPPVLADDALSDAYA